MQIKYGLLAVCLAASAGHAADNSAKVWSGNVKLGGIIHTGNTDDKNLNGALELKYEAGFWQHSLNAKAQYDRGTDDVTADKSSLALNSQYLLNREQYKFLYGNVAASRDRFDPYDFVLKEVLGYGQRFINKPGLIVAVSTGPGARHSRITATQQTRNEFIWQLKGQLDYALNPQVSFKQELLADFGGQNTYMQSISTLHTKLVGNLGFELAFSVQRNSNIPPESLNKKQVDTTTNISLVYKV
jgi:putative salt-induced outer membrane protein